MVGLFQLELVYLLNVTKKFVIPHDQDSCVVPDAEDEFCVGMIVQISKNEHPIGEWCV